MISHKNNNILELCLSPDLGGLELFMVRSSHYLDEKVNMISVINIDGKLEQYYKDTNYKYEKIKRNTALLSFLSAKKLAKIIDDNNIDVLHLHWTKDIPVAVLAKFLSKQKPKLVQTRNMTMTRFKDDFYHRFLYENMDLMLPVTYQVKEQIEKFIPSEIRPKVEVLYMGADTPKQITLEDKLTLREKYNLEDSFTIGIVGRIEKGKGQHLVIDATKSLVQEGLDAKALIVGHAMSDQYLTILKEQIKDDGFEKDIVFSGFTTEVQKLMQVCDVIVLATNRETFGLVLIEAMKSSICIIGSDSGGPLEIIDDNETGLLFKTDNSNDLYTKVKLLIEDKKMKEKLAINAKNKADDKFDSNKQFKKLCDILGKL